MTRYQILAVLVMALFTYLPRFLPLTFFRKKITSKFINSALYYLPYAVLGALTFPGVFNSTPNLVESCAGILVAVFFSYKGKYPKKFEEKYKELQPEKYKETAEHIIQKGNTPAGTHRPICVEEILSFLDVKPGQIGVDATLGYGGHTQKILDCLKGEGHLYSLDVDPIESEKTKKRLRDQGYGENVWDVCLMNFANIAEIEKKAGKLDFVLADLGVSSMQIDDPKRGFSFREEGPLDLRLNPQAGVPASERLKEMDAEEIEGMLFENSDEPLAKELARAIMSAKRKKTEMGS